MPPEGQIEPKEVVSHEALVDIANRQQLVHLYAGHSAIKLGGVAVVERGGRERLLMTMNIGGEEHRGFLTNATITTGSRVTIRNSGGAHRSEVIDDTSVW